MNQGGRGVPVKRQFGAPPIQNQPHPSVPQIPVQNTPQRQPTIQRPVSSQTPASSQPNTKIPPQSGRGNPLPQGQATGNPPARIPVPGQQRAQQHQSQPLQSQQNMNAQSSQLSQIQIPAVIYPISALNPYQPRWAIKARVTFKGPIRTYENERGKGEILTVNLLDQSGEIACTMFGETAMALDRVFQVDKIFFISKGKIKPAGKFNCVACEFEMSLGAGSEVIEEPNDDQTIPQMNYRFISIHDLETTPENTFVDVLAVVQKVNEWTEITSKKDGKQYKKRDILLCDNSDPSGNPISIELSIWGNSCLEFGFPETSVVAIKNARVQRANGVSLSSVASTQLRNASEINSDPPASDLGNWFLSLGENTYGVCLTKAFSGGGTQVLTLKEARDRAQGQEKPVFFVTTGTVMLIKHDENSPLYYTSCPNGDCMKKVTGNEQTGLWECLKCNSAFDTMIPRYILNLTVADHSGSQWMSAFNEAGEFLLDKQALEIYNMRTQGDEKGLADVFQRAAHKTYNLKIKAFEEPFQDEMKLKCSIVGVFHVNFVEASYKLLELIYQMQPQDQMDS